MRNENYPDCAQFIDSVTVFSDLIISAGPDQEVCAPGPAQLNGSVIGASGGIWSGGAGTFTPDRTTLNAQYTPTAEEFARGSLTLTLTSTGNGSCTAVSDQLVLMLQSVFVTIDAPALLCDGATTSLSATPQGGEAPYQYKWNTGESSQTILNKGAGTFTVKVTDANGCAAESTLSIREVPGPSDLSATTKPSSCGRANGGISVTTVSNGTAPYTYSIDGTNFQSSTTFEGLLAKSYSVTVKDANGCTFAKQVVVDDIAGPSDLSAAILPSTCGGNNGEITIKGVSGGTAPFSYSINGTTFQSGASFSNLLAGSYTTMVKDANGCIFSKEVVLNDIAGPTAATASTQPASCNNNDGSITITAVQGGTAPFSYSLGGTTYQSTATFNQLPSGTYEVWVKDANGCSLSVSAKVAKSEPTGLTTTTKPSTCSEASGEISISGVTGGTSPYTYSIDGTTFQSGSTFSGLMSGNYTLTVKDARGCTFSKPLLLEDLPGPFSFSSTTEPSTCSKSNGTVNITSVSGGSAPFTYSKDGTTFQTAATFSGLLAGKHQLTVKDANGCTFSREVTMTDIPGPADITHTSQPGTCGDPNGEIRALSVSGGTAPYTYSIDGTTFQTSAVFTAIAAGDYSLMVKDANGCTLTETVTVTNIAGPADFSATLEPSTCGDANGTVTLHSISGGTAPYSYSANGSLFQSSPTFSGLMAGTYTFTVRDANGCSYTEEVVLNNLSGATAVATSSTPSSCITDDGTLTVDGVTGGTAPYTYSIDGTSFQIGATFSGLAPAEYLLSVKDANGCTEQFPVTIITNGPTAAALTSTNASCGLNDGIISVEAVTAGTAPYTYSLDGSNFQAETSFNGLAAGSYTLTIKDAKGCILVLNQNISNIGGADDFTRTVTDESCGNSNGQLVISNINGGTAPFTFSIDGTNYQENASFSGLAEGIYQLRVKDANGCITIQSDTIINHPAPNGLTFSSQPSTCGNSNAAVTIHTVSGGTAPFTYSIDGVNFQKTATFSAIAAGDYSVWVKDANGCTYAEEMRVENIAGPESFTTTATAATCSEPNGQLSIQSVSGGISPYTYSLDGSNFQTSGTFYELVAGSYSVTVKDANGCTVVQEIGVENIAGPESIALSTVPATCADNNGSVNASSVTGGTMPYTYSLDGTNFQSDSYFSGLASGDYTLWAKDANGCTVSAAFRIEKNEPTDLIVRLQPSSCSNANGSITVEEVIGGSMAYSFALGGGTFQTTPAFEGLMAGTYTLRVKDANGCIYAEQVVLGDKPGPSDFTATPTASTCGEANGSISIGNIAGGTAPFTYSIDGSSFQSSETFNGLIADTYTVWVKDANSCTASMEVALDNTKGPAEMSFSTLSSTCSESNGEIAVTNVSGGTAPYTYSIDGTNFQEAATFTGIPAGEYTLMLKDANGCTLSEAVTVSNIAGPTIMDVSATASSCSENNGTVTINGVSGGTSPYTYAIDGTSFQTSGSFTGLFPGNYTATVKDTNGCTYSKKIVVEDVAGPSSFDYTTEPVSCNGSDGTLTITGVEGGLSPYTYSLDGTNFQAAVTFSGLSSSPYTLFIKDANGCLLSQEVIVPETATGLSELRHPSCYGESDGRIALITTGETGQTAYSIDGGQTFQKESSFTSLPQGEYTITVKFSANCTTTVGPFTLNQPDSLTAVISTTKKATGDQANGSIVVSNIEGGSSPYTLQLDGGVFGKDTLFSGLSGGAHSLTIRDVSGCENTISFTVESILDIEIPDTFTPNGDGINDRWALRNLSVLYPLNKVMVYNRWGAPVFESAGYAKEWEGTHNGKSLPDGTYYFVIYLNETEQPLKGAVTIMR
ncbi:T9SS type B sorting domain-containing protein [Nafulsella turpanensis]|uniref:T9SS type B sorting domain-containing protein n=1 Tax=Nafulsella turpanensis TaxID=1265690 RepID=UPI00034D3D41|nr:gliding motility-associated C-terminal domain-containing protein [Nafulsella turpanensis]